MTTVLLPASSRHSGLLPGAQLTFDVRDRMVQQGTDPALMGSEDFGRFLAAGLPRRAHAV